MRLHETIEKLQKHEVWQARPEGFWRFGERAYLAVVGMSDHATVCYNPEEANIEGVLRTLWSHQDFVPTFEDFRRDDWEEYKG